MKFDLFLSDFDGTLGCNPDYIDLETVDTINEYEKKGGIFTIVTGRSFASIRGICKKYGLKGKVASFQGSTIADLESGEYLLREGVDCQTALEIIKQVKKDGLDFVVWINDCLYYSNVSKYVSIFVADNGVLCEKVSDLEETVRNLNVTVNKVCAFSTSKDAIDDVKKYTGKFKDVTVNSGAEHLIEFINSKYNKGFAVKYLAKMYGVPYNRIIAVGDSTNDLELIDGEWYGVAVGDASNALKEKAKEITLPFNQNPIKHLLNKYCK